MTEDKQAKFLRFTLTIDGINKKSKRDVNDFFEDLTNDIVDRPSFYHCGFWIKPSNMLITTEYWQSNLKAIFFKLVKNRLDILHESYDFLKISYKIEEVEPNFKTREPIVNDPKHTSKRKYKQDSYTKPDEPKKAKKTKNIKDTNDEKRDEDNK